MLVILIYRAIFDQTLKAKCMLIFNERVRIWWLFLLGIVVTAWESASAEDMDCFLQGNRAYIEGDYANAVGYYKRCLEQGQSVTLHYNLGNSYYQAGDVGHAVLHYQKALVINPRHKPSRANLSFVQGAAGLPQMERGPLEGLSALFSLDAWVWLISGSFWSACAVLLLSPFFRLGNGWRRLAFVGFLLVAIGLAGFIGGYPTLYQGVALIKDAPLKLSPNESSPHIHHLQAGEIATAVKERPGWFWVKGSSSRNGWISAAHFQKIWGNSM